MKEKMLMKANDEKRKIDYIVVVLIRLQDLPFFFTKIPKHVMTAEAGSSDVV
jgi:hypothetical protein